jgi:hypothetical protein
VPFGAITWLFLDENGTTCADVIETDDVDREPRLAFWTTFSDTAAVETRYPVGERIDTPDFRSHTISSDVQDAYQHHLRQVADFGTHHGAPIQIKNMDDCLQQDMIYHENHAQRESRRPFLACLLYVTACIYALGASIAVGVSMRHIEALTLQLVCDKLLQLTVLLAPAFVVTLLVSLVSVWRDARARRNK